MCRGIDEGRERWRALWQGDPRLIERAIDRCCEFALERWVTEGLDDADDGELFLRFITRGASGVVESWLEGGCRMPPEQLSALIDRFVLEGRRALTSP
jgi:hypothetical protein